VLCGVSPQTSSDKLLSPNGENGWFSEIDGETPSIARETRALPALNGIVPAESQCQNADLAAPYHRTSFCYAL
jgi:hypothetical protein